MRNPLRLSWKTIRYQLARTFYLSYGAYDHRDALIVKIDDGDTAGYGEMIFVQYYHVDPIGIEQQLSRISNELNTYEGDGPKDFYAWLRSYIPSDYFLLSALDCAMWDYEAKRHGVWVRDLLSLSGTWPAKSVYTVSHINDLYRNNELSSYPLLKLKAGHDAEIDLRDAVLERTSALLIIDANQGWTSQRAMAYLAPIDQHRLICVEEPFLHGDQVSYHDLKNKTGVPIMADESFQHIDDLSEWPSYFDYINLKIMKCGGVTPALEILHEIKARGDLKVMGGCMTGSSISVLPIVHLSGELDGLDADGVEWLESDPWEGLDFDQGWVRPQGCRGIGIKKEPDLGLL